MSTHVAIRTDASLTLGCGHLMRCLTLANGIRRRGGKVHFICRDGDLDVRSIIEADGFDCHRLARGEGDADGLAEIEPGTGLLIVDHYALDAQWEKSARSRVRSILVIDDLANRPHDCDILLNQNLMSDFETCYTGLVPAACRLLLGPAYAILRPEFETVSASPRRYRLDRLLIAFGGTDPGNLTGRVLAGLSDSDLSADVVIGGACPHRDTLAAQCERSGGRWILHIQTSQMSELMRHADLAIGAGGTMHWERCKLGLPALVITIADNQRASTRALAERGACQWLGDGAALPPRAIAAAIDSLRQSPDTLARMQRSAQAIIPPGSGVERILDTIMGVR